MNREERKEFRREAFAEKYGSSRTLYSREEWLKRRPPEQSSINHEIIIGKRLFEGVTDET